MNHKIVITGPESSGKTTLAVGLASDLQLPLIPEYAREYLSSLDRPYQLEDVEHMARKQHELESAKSFTSVVCDTDLTVYSIWLNEKYNHSLEWIESHLNQCNNHIYFLCDTLTHWENDPLREHPNLTDRKRLFQAYQNLLEKHQLEYYILSGNATERLKKATEILATLI